MSGILKNKEVAIIETSDEIMKEEIGRFFSKNCISYLIKTNKVRALKRGRFESKNIYSFIVNRFQEEEARTILESKFLVQEELAY